MFCSSPTPPLGQRLLGALRLARSFLLLEDDYEVDWEVDQDELAAPMGRGLESDRSDRDESAGDGYDPAGGNHPHRMALQSRLGPRRPGIVVPDEQVCLCPVGGRARAGVSRGSFSPERSCAVLPRGAGSSRNP